MSLSQEIVKQVPKQMHAVEIREAGGPEVLTPAQFPTPKPQKGEILVRVHAAGVNRPDVAQRQGKYPAPQGTTPLPGLEIAGEVALCGEDSKRFQCGDRVMTLIPGGGYAEYAVVHEDNAMPIPETVDYIEAAAFPETFITVWDNVFQRGALKKGETLLIHGGSSGIGTAAIQLAKAFGAKVIVTAGSDEKCDACRKLGADLAINYRTDDFVEVINSFSDRKGVDVILDMVGGDYVERNLKIAAVEGRIVQIAFLNGHKATINLNQIMQKRLVYTGSTLRARSVAFKASVIREIETHVLPLLAAQRVKPLIDKVYPLNDAVEAHRRMEKSAHIGKIVLQVIK